MKFPCPKCKTSTRSRVIDSRVGAPKASLHIQSIRRRRECAKCKTRQTTYEVNHDDYTDLVRADKALDAMAIAVAGLKDKVVK